MHKCLIILWRMFLIFMLFVPSTGNKVLTNTLMFQSCLIFVEILSFAFCLVTSECGVHVAFSL